jgi:hypothetical protein
MSVEPTLAHESSKYDVRFDNLSRHEDLPFRFRSRANPSAVTKAYVPVQVRVLLNGGTSCAQPAKVLTLEACRAPLARGPIGVRGCASLDTVEVADREPALPFRGAISGLDHSEFRVRQASRPHERLGRSAPKEVRRDKTAQVTGCGFAVQRSNVHWETAGKFSLLRHPSPFSASRAERRQCIAVSLTATG